MHKKLLILLGIVFFLGLIFFFIDHPSKDRHGKPAAFFDDLKVEAISAVETFYFTRGIRLEKDPQGVWWVMPAKTDLAKQAGVVGEDFEKKPADSEKVTRLLSTLLGLTKSAPVSTNPAKLPIFEIMPAGLQVLFFDKDDKKLAGLLVGKQGPTFLSTYVKKDDDPAVYLVGEPLSGILNKPAEEWIQNSDTKSD